MYDPTNLLAPVHTEGALRIAFDLHARLGYEDADTVAKLAVPLFGEKAAGQYADEFSRTNSARLAMFATSFSFAILVAALPMYDEREDEFLAASPRASYSNLCRVAALLRDRMKELSAATAAKEA